MALGAVVVVGATWLVVGQAGAAPTAPSGFHFTVQRDPGAERCPNQKTLENLVAKRLAAGSARVPLADSVAVSVTPDDTGFLATLSSRGMEGGLRRLHDDSRDCAGLGEALGLMLAMIADGRPLPPAPVPTPIPAAPAPQRPPRPWQIGATAMLSTMLDAGTLGYALDVDWHPTPRLVTGITGSYFPNRAIEGGGGTVNVSAAGGWARSCWGLVPMGGRFFPAVCAQLGGGVFHGSAENFDDARSATRPWFGAGPMVRADLRLWRQVSLTIGVARLFFLRKQTFTVAGLGPVFESAGAWLGQAGVRVRIP
jgi:hypothetical protein